MHTLHKRKQSTFYNVIKTTLNDMTSHALSAFCINLIDSVDCIFSCVQYVDYCEQMKLSLRPLVQRKTLVGCCSSPLLNSERSWPRTELKTLRGYTLTSLNQGAWNCTITNNHFQEISYLRQLSIHRRICQF